MRSERLLTTPRFSIERLTFDVKGVEQQRAVVRHPGSVVIIPLLGDGRVCLIKNHRVAVGETLIELPAGTLEPHESPVACAKREVIEETGYEAGSLLELTAFFAAPGILDEKMHLFLAEDLHPGEARREPGEQIENYVVSLEDALGLIASGKIHDAKTMVGLLLVARRLEQAG